MDTSRYNYAPQVTTPTTIPPMPTLLHSVSWQLSTVVCLM